MTTKLLHADIRAGRAAQAIEESFSLLKTDHIDLFLIHWPVEGWQAAWRALEACYGQGRLGAIGVSNFQIHHLEELMQFAQVRPAVNQFECHPYLQQRPFWTTVPRPEFNARHTVPSAAPPAACCRTRSFAALQRKSGGPRRRSHCAGSCSADW